MESLLSIEAPVPVVQSDKTKRLIVWVYQIGAPVALLGTHIATKVETSRLGIFI